MVQPRGQGGPLLARGERFDGFEDLGQFAVAGDGADLKPSPVLQRRFAIGPGLDLKGQMHGGRLGRAELIADLAGMGAQARAFRGGAQIGLLRRALAIEC